MCPAWDGISSICSYVNEKLRLNHIIVILGQGQLSKYRRCKVETVPSICASVTALASSSCDEKHSSCLSTVLGKNARPLIKKNMNAWEQFSELGAGGWGLCSQMELLSTFFFCSGVTEKDSCVFFKDNLRGQIELKPT